MSDETKPEPEVREGSRIAKVMARAGLCSRREAETWIAEGRVSVNGKALESPAYNVTDEDDVRVDGKRLTAPERTRLFLFHKVRGLVTTARDPEGRTTIFDALPPDLPRVVAVGRLDINTEGLLLLTNDGGLARVLELPSTGWLRRYRVRAHGTVGQAQLDALSDGITIDGIDYAGIEARLDREQGSNAWITMGLREGKNREIKRVLEHLGLSVNRLIRVSFGPFELGDLGEGEVAEVRTRVLRDQLGIKLAKEAGVDFDAPIADHAPIPIVEPPREERPRRAASAGKARRAGPERERGRERDEAPRREPPAPSTPERKRKHVSVLRAQVAADGAGPRKRIARGATQDRKGRTVAVERISKAVVEAKEERRGRSFETGPERPRRSASFAAKRARDGEGRERPPRGERHEESGRNASKPRGARKPWEDRGSSAPRVEGGEARPSRRAPRPEGEARPASKPYTARKPWEDRAPRPPRAEGGEARPPRRAPRAEGGAGAASKPYEARAASKPYAARKPWEDRAPRPPRAEGDVRPASKPYTARKPWEDRAPRPPRVEGGEARPPRRDEQPRGGAGGRGPSGYGGKPKGAAGGGRRPGGGPPKAAGGPRRPPPKR